MENEIGNQESQEIQPRRPSMSSVQSEDFADFFELFPRYTAEFLNRRIPEAPEVKTLTTQIAGLTRALRNTRKHRILNAIIPYRRKVIRFLIANLEKELRRSTLDRRRQQFEFFCEVDQNQSNFDKIAAAPQVSSKIDNRGQRTDPEQRPIDINTISIEGRLAELATRPSTSKSLNHNRSSSSDEGCSTTPKRRGNRL
ncbi:hypothetical protein FGM00_11215 [Aggregatimonas sangjinii]|uniref:Uncharacterized protein n=1 Tax=Aggregatimonas sangjinii TaxID=2583587 RepID=A0A5B7SPY3_9FLAO|nr:hypothetical protein [Aggregatimonas sangjinii]QCX00646.1 hypothetical protein FGM00_11215 [Aggregatimonas sangjinii]